MLEFEKFVVIVDKLFEVNFSMRVLEFIFWEVWKFYV